MAISAETKIIWITRVMFGLIASIFIYILTKDFQSDIKEYVTTSFEDKMVEFEEERLVCVEGFANQYAMEFYTDKKGWKIKTYDRLSSEARIKHCNLVDKLDQFDADIARKQGIYFAGLISEIKEYYNEKKPKLWRTPFQYVRDLFQNFDQERAFNQTSELYLPDENKTQLGFMKDQYKFENMSQDFQKFMRQTEIFQITLSEYLFIAQIDPIVAFSQNGGVVFKDIHNQSRFIVVQWNEFMEFLNLNDIDYIKIQQLQTKKQELLSYLAYSLNTMISQEKIDQFSHFTADLVVTHDLDVKIIEFDKFNILGTLSKERLSQGTQVYVKNALNIMHDIMNWKKIQKTKIQIAQQLDLRKQEYQIQTIINESMQEKHQYLTLRNQTNLDFYLEPKKLICSTHFNHSVIKRMEIYTHSSYYDTWKVKRFPNTWQNNPQQCDVIYISRYKPYTEAKPYLNTTRQLVLQIPFSRTLNTKDSFYYQLITYKNPLKHNYKIKNALPHTYFIKQYTSINDRDSFEFMNLKEQYDKEGKPKPWIFKPSSGARGQNIQVFKDVKDAQKFYKSEKNNPKAWVNGIMQEYIYKVPTLFKKKFDLRMYLLLGWNQRNANLAFYDEGYARRSYVDYDTNIDLSDPDNIFKHLTNNHIQQQYKNKSIHKHNATTTSMDDFRDYMRNHYDLSDQKIVSIFNEVRKSFAYIAETFFASKEPVPGTMELFGVDVIFDSDWNPYLIEANSGPGLEIDEDARIQQSLRMVKNYVDHIVFMFNNREKADEMIKNNKFPSGTMQVLINGATNYNYINDLEGQQ